jgi:predicted short-subunit dehydrogenase-like oxidoreductase (DUF2520 family)
MSLESTHAYPAQPGLRTIAVVGRGRLGTALSSALRTAGFKVSGPLRRGERTTADAVLLCVPDSEIPAAAAALAGCAPLVGHTSGATPLSALEPAGAERFGLHPLQTFTGGEGLERFTGVGCAVAGSSQRALAAATAIAGALGMRAFELADEDRAAYHAAASIASNFLVVLESAAETAARSAGLEPARARELLAPLVRATVENWAELGPERSLTGPVARGDELTVAKQRAALREQSPELLPLFDALAAQARVLAGRREAAA